MSAAKFEAYQSGGGGLPIVEGEDAVVNANKVASNDEEV